MQSRDTAGSVCVPAACPCAGVGIGGHTDDPACNATDPRDLCARIGGGDTYCCERTPKNFLGRRTALSVLGHRSSSGKVLEFGSVFRELFAPESRAFEGLSMGDRCIVEGLAPSSGLLILRQAVGPWWTDVYGGSVELEEMGKRD